MVRKTSRAELQDLCIRMVVPMRREFGMALEVDRMLDDPAYARRIIELALHASEERLRKYAALAAREIEREAVADARASRNGDAAAAQGLGVEVDARLLGEHAAQCLLALLGPYGEVQARDLREASDAASLRSSLQAARDAVDSLLGAAVAADFMTAATPGNRL